MNQLPVVLLSLCLLSVAGDAFAQGRYVSTMRAIRAGVMSNGSKFSRIAAREFFADRISLSVTEFKTADAIRSGLLAHGVQESLRLSEQYRSNLNKFLEIKRELDIFLRYQMLEPENVTSVEVNARWEDARKARQALREMERIVGARDRGVHLGKLYMDRVMEALKPNYAGSLSSASVSMPEKLRAENSFNADKFLLKDPDGTSLTMKNTSPGSDGFARARKMAAELPPMTIAVLNDDPEILEWARAWNAQGFLGTGSRMAVFDSLTKLMEWVKEVKYDVILMDYVLEDGVSVFMIDRIRMAGDKSTIILVNSALMDDEVPAEDLFEHGADGFISSVGFRADNGGARIANALYNYMGQHGRDALTPHSKR